jgi:RNA-directed DNA polymerase
MKRVAGLFDQIHQLGNLRAATARAMRGKRNRAEVRRFLESLDDNLAALSLGIREGALPLGRFNQFVIHDPKERLISAPCFRERVLHHAVMSVCEPVMESFAISDSYACRIGGGQFAALSRARHFSRRHRFFLKLDVRKYFESIPKQCLISKLERRFRERRLIDLLANIVHSFEPERSRGLPIGSLTSQHFANFYLGYLDRFAKEQLQIRGYVRYMDDFVLWHNDRSLLRTAAGRIAGFAEGELGLSIKPALINPVVLGLEFLGHRVYPEGNRLNRRSRRRYRDRVMGIERRLDCGKMGEREAQARLDAATAFTKKASCKRWRRHLLFGGGQPPETAPNA